MYLVANSFGTVVGERFAGCDLQNVTKIVFTGTLVGDAWRLQDKRKAQSRAEERESRGNYAFGSARVHALVGKKTYEETLTLSCEAFSGLLTFVATCRQSLALWPLTHASSHRN